MASLPSSAAALRPRSRPRPLTRKARRRPNRRLIKIHRNYTVEEAARVTGCAKGTIRRWINSGDLPAIVDQRPNLILGADLREFLQTRAAPGPKLQLHQFYCFRCRMARDAAFGAADYLPMTAATGNLRGLCGTCTTLMHKVIAKSSLVGLMGILEVTVQQGRARLIDTAQPSLNNHLLQEPEPHA